EEAARLGIKVTRVPAYSPYAVAEHAVALMLALDRKLCRAVGRVRDLNFSLDGLVGFDLHGKTVGIIGGGRIGGVLARIMKGFGCKVLLHDMLANPELEALGASYVSLGELLERSDIVSLHLPLTASSHHMIGAAAIEQMKPGVMLINTSRGGLIDASALIAGLKSGRIGAAGLDVYEEEENVFFQDLSATVLQDDVLARLMTFPNVLITAHQAFLTQEALHNIVETTLASLNEFERKIPLTNEVRIP
ncbi:MAG: NAD(P)-dependent oxidoreductase, partial [Bdellovibrionota bacterium]